MLKDELFLRTSRGMEPTPYALHLAEPVSYALNALQAALTTRDSFEPQTSSRNFQLAMTDIGEMYFMPPLMEALARLAPQVRVSTVRPNAANLKEDMESGTVDLALGLFPNLQTGFFQRRLFRHRYVCVFRQGHPVARSPMSLEQFCELDHAAPFRPTPATARSMACWSARASGVGCGWWCRISSRSGTSCKAPI